LLPANGLGACQLELTVEQPRHLLRGGPICVAKAWWSGTLARGRKSASEGFAVRLPLELNPQYAGSNAGTSGGPGAPGGVAAASTQDLESGGVGGCCVEVQLQGVFRGDAADLVAQCVQGQSDSDDESDDDVAASDEEEEEEEEDHEAAAEAAEEAMVAAAAAVARAGDDERGASAKSVLPSVDKAGSASEAATRLTKAARLKSLRAAKAHKAAAREAARKKTPDEVAAAKAEAEAETMLASITVSLHQLKLARKIWNAVRVHEEKNTHVTKPCLKMHPPFILKSRVNDCCAVPLLLPLWLPARCTRVRTKWWCT
jgi:hypothetical protein